jgi:hypothetical protein
MITTDRKAASTTRIEISGIRREVTEIAECIDNNNTAIDERFSALEQDSATKSSTLAEFTKSITEAYRTVYEE